MRKRAMGKRISIAFTMAVACLISACVHRAADSPLALSGRQIAEQKCATCHAIGETGASPDANAPVFRSLYGRYPIDALRESFARGLQVGHRNMPQFVLPQAETDRILDYLRELDPCGRPSSDAAAMAACFAPIQP